MELGIWIGVFAGVLLSLGLGYLLGHYAARNALTDSLSHSARGLQELLSLLHSKLGEAVNICHSINQQSGALSETQTRDLAETEVLLSTQLKSLHDRSNQHIANKRRTPKAEKKAEFPCVWKSEPTNPETKLPDPTCFSHNLQLLSRCASDNDQPRALLLIQLDKVEQLRQRFGEDNVRQVLRELRRCVLRQMSDDDLYCETLLATGAVFCVPRDRDSWSKWCTELCTALRNLVFRQISTGEEMLVSCSVGLSFVQTEDTPDTVRNKVEIALKQAQRQGRNQLVFHDGARLHSVESVTPTTADS